MQDSYHVTLPKSQLPSLRADHARMYLCSGSFSAPRIAIWIASNMHVYNIDMHVAIAIYIAMRGAEKPTL